MPGPWMSAGRPAHVCLPQCRPRCLASGAGRDAAALSPRAGPAGLYPTHGAVPRAGAPRRVVQAGRPLGGGLGPGKPCLGGVKRGWAALPVQQQLVALRAVWQRPLAGHARLHAAPGRRHTCRAGQDPLHAPSWPRAASLHPPRCSPPRGFWARQRVAGWGSGRPRSLHRRSPTSAAPPCLHPPQIEGDAQAVKKLGWVREMYAFSIAAAVERVPLAVSVRGRAATRLRQP